MKINRSESGLSLMEILISLLVLSLIAGFVAISIPATSGLTTATDKIETSTALAQKYIEDVKAESVNNADFFTSVTAGNTPPLTLNTEHTGNGKYGITTNTQILNTFEAVPCLIQLDVTVTPTTQSSNSRPVSVSTLIRRDRY